MIYTLETCDLWSVCICLAHFAQYCGRLKACLNQVYRHHAAAVSGPATCLAHVLYKYSCREGMIQGKPMRIHAPNNCCLVILVHERLLNPINNSGQYTSQTELRPVPEQSKASHCIQYELGVSNAKVVHMCSWPWLLLRSMLFESSAATISVPWAADCCISDRRLKGMSCQHRCL